MFRTVPPSIIRSFSLYTQQWYLPYMFADSLRPGSGRNWFRPGPGRKLSAVWLYQTHPDIGQTAYMEAWKNTIKPHYVFLRMNIWVFETCRRQHNWIKSLIKKCAFCWFVLLDIHTFLHDMVRNVCEKTATADTLPATWVKPYWSYRSRSVDRFPLETILPSTACCRYFL